MAYYKKVDGGKCYLSPIDLGDFEKYTGWLNDPEVFRFLNLATVNITLDAEQEALSEISRKHNYGIIDSSEDNLIGICGFVSIDQLNQSAECGIFIGDKEYWNKGYGSRALYCLLYYGFEYLNLHNIMLQVYSFNERGISCYQKCGFKEIGRRREALLREGKRWDIIHMDIIRNEFDWRPGI